MDRRTAQRLVRHWRDSYARALAVNAMRMEGEDDHHLVMTWDDKGKLAGVVGWHDDGGYLVIDQIATNRTGGVGRRMMARMASDAHKRNKWVRLAPSPGAVGFYEHLGFERLNRAGVLEEEMILRDDRLASLAREVSA